MQKAIYVAPTDSYADDSALLIRIQNGDRMAFRILLQLHSSRFYRLAYSFVHNQTEAEDIVQDAFLKLWERPDSWNPEAGSAFTTWFYRLVVNLCLGNRKKKRPLQLPETMEIVDGRDSQEEILMQNQNEFLLEKQISVLPQRQQTALNLCFYEGLSNQEAARIMGVNIKALQSLLMRAKMTLKNKLIDKNGG